MTGPSRRSGGRAGAVPPLPTVAELAAISERPRGALAALCARGPV